jgi:hypothetical protein
MPPLAHAPTPSIPDLEQRVRQALAGWYGEAAGASPLAGLALVQQAQAAGSVTAHRASNEVLRAALDRLEAAWPKEAGLLRRRFVDDKPVFVVARELNMAEATFYKHQRRAIGNLAAVLADMERQARSEHSARAEARLPWLDSQRLFGVEPLLEHLLPRLTSAEAPWLLALVGLGGIGKTAVARSALERIVHNAGVAVEVGWVSAQQQTFHPSGVIRPVEAPALSADDLLLALATQLLPAGARVAPFSSQRALAALRAHLQAIPHLVVIDNLETLPDVEALLPTLRRLVGPSRFLLTSRKALPDEPDIYHLPVPELAEADALALLRHEAQMRNLQAVVDASDADLQPICETVGGNPLALKLVVGQLYLLPLPQVLDNLRQARGRKASDLYRFIYWQAWNQLDADGQEALLCMPVFAQGGADLASIERVCEVQGGRLIDALELLARLSLVNIGGGLHARRYSIHRLTETFLLQEVIRWQGLAGDWGDEPAGLGQP